MSAGSSGTTVMFANLGPSNTVVMLVGTTIVVIGISFVLMSALRSLRVGLTSLVPNSIPKATGFGILGFAVGQVGVYLSVMTAMTLGIVRNVAVPATIPRRTVVPCS